MMATDEAQTYNGWTNYETWVVKLWMDNEEPTHRYWRESAQQVWDATEAEGIFTHADNASIRLADIIKSDHEEALPELQGFASDLLRAGFDSVNWDEIARSLIDDGIESGDLSEDDE